MTDCASLMDLVQEYLESKKLHLPVLAPAALELREMLSREEVDIDEVSNRIMQDQALTSNLLRMGNSAFYGGLKQVVTIKEAIMRLGTREVMNLVLLCTQRDNYASASPLIKPFVGGLWKHAAACAMGSHFLAARLGRREYAQEAFLAGLLHDIGHLFLLKAIENIQASPTHQGVVVSNSVLHEVLDNMHSEQGALLLKQWNLPQVYSDVARLHHEKDYSGGNTVVTIVRLANIACHKLGIGLHEDPGLVLATTDEARTLHAPEVLLAEMEIMLEDAVAATG